METPRWFHVPVCVGVLVAVFGSGSRAAAPRDGLSGRDYLARFAAGRAEARAAMASPLSPSPDALAHLHDPDDHDHDDDEAIARIAARPRGAEGGGFSALNVNLIAHVPVNEISSTSTEANDIWGYVSPAGREYAIIGLNLSTGFVDITNPVNPLVVADIGDAASLWSDMRAYQGFAYNVNENGGGLQIIDLRNIDAGVVTLVGSAIGGLTTAHNVSLNGQSGFLYACSTNLTSGFVAYDLTDPGNPVPVGTWNGGNCHDLYLANYVDCPYAGRTGPCEIAFVSAGGGGLRIVDATNKSNMTTIAIYNYPNRAYTHQGWLTEDRRYFVFGDESDEGSFDLPTTTYIVNVENVAAPIRVSEYDTGLNSIDHNLMIRGNYVFQADYTTGLQVFDISNVLNAQKVGFFDTFPPHDARVFSGAWGVYSDLPSGMILISDIEGGLFVLDASPAVGCQQDTHCDDRNPCTIDTCNVSGQCEQAFVDAGTACDDDDVCTSAGVCDGAGNCGVTDINTIPCADDTVCAPGTCNVGTGLCECAPCLAVARPTEQPVVVPRVRYLSVTPDNPGVPTALRVTLSALPAQFAALSGTQWWVGAPFPVAETPGSAGSTPADFLAARLSCSRVFMDWGSVGTVEVFGEAIVPGGTYDVQAISQPCFNAGLPRYSSARRVQTSKWGDVVGNCTVTPCTPPDGTVNVTTDIVGILDKFAGRAGAPAKARADLEPALPDLIINITDVLRGLSAFTGLPYPFAGPTPCP